MNTDADNTIECEISPDKKSAEFNCSKPFKLYDDRETLSLMRMGQIDPESISSMLPDPGLGRVPQKSILSPLSSVGQPLMSDLVSFVQNNIVLTRVAGMQSIFCDKTSPSTLLSEQ